MSLQINQTFKLGLFPPGGSIKPEVLACAQQAVSIYNSRLQPSQARDEFIKLIRQFWDSNPTVEAEVNNEIQKHAKAISGVGSKADRILNNSTTPFTARQLLKFASWDFAYLLAISASSTWVITVSLNKLVADGSLTSWISAANGYDRMDLAKHILAHFDGPLAHQTVSPAATTTEVTITTENDMTQTIEADATTPATPVVPPAMKPAIDAVLASAGIPSTIDALLAAVARVNKAESDVILATKMATEMSALMKSKEDMIDSLQRKIQQAQAVATTYTVPSHSSAGVPNGSSKMVQAETLFPILKGMQLEIPAWQWDHAHPDVPAENPAYIFRKEMLVKFLLALKRGDNCWFQGHTGSGKTTFVEQVAARLQWPVARIAFDSAIDRSELVGRMQLKSDGKGGTVSEWLKGVLELAIPNGYILLCDEFDAGRPDALYVLQEVLEHKAKRLLEDGGRFIDYHPMSRVIATGNTCGSGDPSGIYPATRILSGATLDRFGCFIHVPYMTQQEESDLIASQTSLSKQVITKLAKFATEMRQAFVRAEIPISYSPRRSIAFARATEDLSNILGSAAMDKAQSLALQQTVYDAAPEEFKQRIVEIARAALGGNIDPTVKL